MKALVALTLCLATLGASAQTVYRCGNAYSQEPCPQARQLDVSDERSNAQRAEAQRVADSTRERGLQMERERLARAAAQRPSGASNLGPAPVLVKARASDRAKPKKLKWTKLKEPKGTRKSA